MPYKKGQSGNPNGRPKERPFTDALRHLLFQPYTGKRIGLPRKPTMLQVLARKLVTEALDGNKYAILEIMDRIDGKVGYATPDIDDKPPSAMTHEESIIETAHKIAALLLK